METQKSKILNVIWKAEQLRVVWADLQNVWKRAKLYFQKLLGNNGKDWTWDIWKLKGAGDQEQHGFPQLLWGKLGRCWRL